MQENIQGRSTRASTSKEQWARPWHHTQPNDTLPAGLEEPAPSFTPSMNAHISQDERVSAAILLLIGAVGAVSQIIIGDGGTAIVFGALGVAGLTKWPRPGSQAGTASNAIVIAVALAVIGYFIADASK